MNGRWQLVVLSLVGLALALAAGLALAQGPASQGALAGAPMVVSYQGQVTVGGSAFNGTGFFKFAVVDAAGTTTYWSNDGTSTGGGEPTNGTPLPVTRGLFNVLLGDTSLTNMTQPLDAAAFDGADRYLRVWFSSDNINFQKLSQDRRIAAVPYALQASNADTLDGQDASDLTLANGTLVLGRTPAETTLIDAGFSYTGLIVQVDKWRSLQDMDTPRRFLAAAAVDGIIYAIGGQSAAGGSGQYETANEAYDPATDSWISRASMNTGRIHLAAAAADGKVYAIGGWDGSNYQAANEAYDPTTNQWTSKNPLPSGRSDLAAVTVDGVVYAIGGFDSTGFMTETLAYHPDTDSWVTTLESLSVARSDMGATAVDGLIYVTGGSNGWLADTWAYDPVTDSWDTSLEALPEPRKSHVAVAVDGIVYVIGGQTNDGGVTPYQTSVEAYDPASDSWTTRASMPTGRQDLAGVAVDGVIYAVGGQSGLSGPSMYEAANEAYTPVLYVYDKD